MQAFLNRANILTLAPMVSEKLDDLMGPLPPLPSGRGLSDVASQKKSAVLGKSPLSF